MNDFKVIYKILKVLDASMDYDELDPERISAEALGVTERRRQSIFAMLQESGYVNGVHVVRYADKAGRVVLINPKELEITLDGIAYLNDNSLMKKAANAAKGIIDVVS